MKFSPCLATVLAATALPATVGAQGVRSELTVHIKTPMPAPAWALSERALLRHSSMAVEQFAVK